jgi:hypothetical protein
MYLEKIKISCYKNDIFTSKTHFKNPKQQNVFLIFQALFMPNFATFDEKL